MARGKLEESNRLFEQILLEEPTHLMALTGRVHPPFPLLSLPHQFHSLTHVWKNEIGSYPLLEIIIPTRLENLSTNLDSPTYFPPRPSNRNRIMFLVPR